jgi:TetR/AcrR family transcriptional repressor of uid operon
MTEDQDKPSGREAQRLQTRQRVLDAAVAEFKRSGIAGADVGAIVAAAGVARGTFYFHFPTKEHVLLELERREEIRIADELSHFLESPHDLSSALAEVVRLVLSVEERLGGMLFKDVLGLHFSSTRPADDEWLEHPVIVLVVKEIERARDSGEIPEVNAFHSAVFFLLGLYALLTATHDAQPVRTAMLDNFVSYVRGGLEAVR